MPGLNEDTRARVHAALIVGGYPDGCNEYKTVRFVATVDGTDPQPHIKEIHEVSWEDDRTLHTGRVYVYYENGVLTADY